MSKIRYLESSATNWKEGFGWLGADLCLHPFFLSLFASINMHAYVPLTMCLFCEKDHDFHTLEDSTK